MKHISFALLAALVAATITPGYATCSAPKNEHQTKCHSCGNLEQNPERGHDYAWNAYLEKTQMQLELQVFGATKVHLTDPPFSSPGVLYYTDVIEDPQFTVTSSSEYSEAVTLMNEYSIAFSYEDANPQAEFLWRRSQEEKIRNAVSRSVTTGSQPYRMRLFDSHGNTVPGGNKDQPRLTPVQDILPPGPSDTEPNDKYTDLGCISKDPREDDDGSDNTTSGNDGGDDVPDMDFELEQRFWDWEMEEAWGRSTPACYTDFSWPDGLTTTCPR